MVRSYFSWSGPSPIISADSGRPPQFVPHLTLAGIDWATLRPGTRLQIGEVEAEITAWAQPCKKNAQWFTDEDFRRMEHDRHPGWSRAYAWVRTPGVVRTGDPVVVEP